MEQGSPEWFAERVGKVTASRISDVMAKLKSGAEAAGRSNYRAELVLERLTGVKQDSYTSAAMQRGIDLEPIARAAYEVTTGRWVDEVGFVPHPEIEGSGASPDGLVDGDGMAEIKCPNSATHLEYILTGKIPAHYQLQMQWQMACTGRKWVDFISFDDRFPEENQLLVIRLQRDDKQIAEIHAEVVALLGEVEQKLEALKKATMIRV
jgi:putative phage-type endonuclease